MAGLRRAVAARADSLDVLQQYYGLVGAVQALAARLSDAADIDGTVAAQRAELERLMSDVRSVCGDN